MKKYTLNFHFDYLSNIEKKDLFIVIKKFNLFEIQWLEATCLEDADWFSVDNQDFIEQNEEKFFVVYDTNDRFSKGEDDYQCASFNYKPNRQNCAVKVISFDLNMHISTYTNFINFIFQNYTNLIYASAYEKEDVINQSYDDYEMYKKGYFKIAGTVRTTKNKRGETIINTSQNYGRSFEIANLKLVAAPKMWFGRSYIQSFFKEDSITNSFSTNLLKTISSELLEINLFDIHSDPSTNRNIQKKFWETSYFSELEKSNNTNSR